MRDDLEQQPVTGLPVGYRGRSASHPLEMGTLMGSAIGGHDTGPVTNLLRCEADHA